MSDTETDKQETDSASEAQPTVASPKKQEPEPKVRRAKALLKSIDYYFEGIDANIVANDPELPQKLYTISSLLGYDDDEIDDILEAATEERGREISQVEITVQAYLQKYLTFCDDQYAEFAHWNETGKLIKDTRLKRQVVQSNKALAAQPLEEVAVSDQLKWWFLQDNIEPIAAGTHGKTTFDELRKLVGYKELCANDSPSLMRHLTTPSITLAEAARRKRFLKLAQSKKLLKYSFDTIKEFCIDTLTNENSSQAELGLAVQTVTGLRISETVDERLTVTKIADNAFEISGLLKKRGKLVPFRKYTIVPVDMTLASIKRLREMVYSEDPVEFKKNKTDHDKLVNAALRTNVVFKPLCEAFQKHYNEKITAHNLRAVYAAKAYHEQIDEFGEGHQLPATQELLGHAKLEESRFYYLFEHKPREDEIQNDEKAESDDEDALQAKLDAKKAKNEKKRALEEYIDDINAMGLDDEDKEKLIADAPNKQKFKM